MGTTGTLILLGITVITAEIFSSVEFATMATTVATTSGTISMAAGFMEGDLAGTGAEVTASFPLGPFGIRPSGFAVTLVFTADDTDGRG